MRDENDVGWVVFFLVWALVLWAVWYVRLVPVTTLASSHRDRRVLYLTPPICVLVLLVLLLGRVVGDLQRWHSSLLHCWSVGVCLLGVAVWAIPWLGLSPRDDVAEHCNRPAGWAIGGGALGLIVAFGCAAGEVLGTPGEWSVFLIGPLSMIILLALWGILERLAHPSEAITVDRDAGAACRFAALLIALGLLVGQVLPALLSSRAVTPALAALGGPAVLLLAGVLVELARTPYGGPPGGPPRKADVLIGLSYLGGAALWSYLGR
jgi:hypothetical protein